ncbi:unnamed protein product, partial [Ceratitis capitata]
MPFSSSLNPFYFSSQSAMPFECFYLLPASKQLARKAPSQPEPELQPVWKLLKAYDCTPIQLTLLLWLLLLLQHLLLPQTLCVKAFWLHSSHTCKTKGDATTYCFLIVTPRYNPTAPLPAALLVFVVQIFDVGQQRVERVEVVVLHDFKIICGNNCTHRMLQIAC